MLGGSTNVTGSLDLETIGNLGTILERRAQKPSGMELEMTLGIPTLGAQRVFKSQIGTRPYKLSSLWIKPEWMGQPSP